MSAAEAAPVSDAEAATLFADLATTENLVLAVSGGPDSTALLLLAARWRAGLRVGPALLAITVDHGLRPESGREAAAVKRLAGRLGIAHRTMHWRGDKPKTRLQEAARNARYRLLAQAALASGAKSILTAHTLDDQAETVLFRLARGSGVAGLAGMARETSLGAIVDGMTAGRAGEIVLLRPFLGIPKARLIATLQAAGEGFADDPSNRDPRFARPRLRRALAMLAAEGLDAGRLALLARRARRADEAIEWAAAAAARRLLRDRGDGSEVAVDAVALRDLPIEIALRLLRSAIARVGDEGPVELGKLEALMASMRPALTESPGRRWRRTLAGALVTISGSEVSIASAPARRRDPHARKQGPERSRRAGERPFCY